MNWYSYFDLAFISCMGIYGIYSTCRNWEKTRRHYVYFAYSIFITVVPILSIIRKYPHISYRGLGISYALSVGVIVALYGGVKLFEKIYNRKLKKQLKIKPSVSKETKMENSEEVIQSFLSDQEESSKKENNFNNQ